MKNRRFLFMMVALCVMGAMIILSGCGSSTPGIMTPPEQSAEVDNPDMSVEQYGSQSHPDIIEQAEQTGVGDSSPPPPAQTPAEEVVEIFTPQIPANAEIVYDGDDFIITQTRLMSFHPFRSDRGEYSIPSIAPPIVEYSDGLLRISNMITRTQGFMDKNGNIRIACQFDDALCFSEGLAAVKTYNEWTGGFSWGFINTAGEMVIPAQFDDAHSFSEGLAAVRINNEWGYIDKTGEAVIPFGKFLGVSIVGRGFVAHDFHDGLAYTSYEADGRTYTCFINARGEIVIDMRSFADRGIHEASDFKEGLSRIGSNGRMGFMDTSGNIVIELPEEIWWGGSFSRVHDFHEGHAVIMTSGWNGYVIDKDGNTVFSLEEAGRTFGVGEFSEGAIPVRSNESEQFGFVNTAGEVVLPFVYRHAASGFHCGLAVVNTAMGTSMYIDVEGNSILSYSTPQGGGIYLGNFIDDSAIAIISGSNGISTVYHLQILRR